MKRTKVDWGKCWLALIDAGSILIFFPAVHQVDQDNHQNDYHDRKNTDHDHPIPPVDEWKYCFYHFLKDYWIGNTKNNLVAFFKT